MKSKSRIASIARSISIDSSITGLPTFHLSALDIPLDLDFQLPTNIRLGHLAEKIVAELIKSSKNYKVKYENIQIIENQKTIGEIDFIIENLNENKFIHLELAYKFYLFDPSISQETLRNWIGPNRNDSLAEKLEKLKTKQFPLLYLNSTATYLDSINIKNVSQSLCLLASLFVPFNFQTKLEPAYQKAIKGYYFNLATFLSLDSSEKSYYLPPKKEWGMDASANEIWTSYEEIENQLKKSISEKQSPMCWQKQKDSYISFFIVWW